MKQHLKKTNRKIPMSISILRWGFAFLGRVFPNISSIYAYRLWFKTRRFPNPKREEQWLTTARIKRIMHAGLPLTVYEWGSGPTVLMVHGWNGRALQFGKLGINLATQGYHAVAVDLPAHGQTPGTSTNAFVLAEAISAIINHYGVIHGIVCHSFAAIPISIIFKKNSLSQRLLLVCPPNNAHFLLNTFVSMLTIPEKIRDKLSGRIEKEFGENIWDELDVAKNLCKSSSNGLVIHDLNDIEVPLDCGQSIVQSWPSAGLHKTQGLGHTRILRDQRVIDTITNFLEKPATEFNR